MPHSARHSLATFLLDNSVPLPRIQELLGHAHLKVTKKYTHIYENTIQKIGKKAAGAREEHKAENEKIVEFKVS